MKLKNCLSVVAFAFSLTAYSGTQQQLSVEAASKQPVDYVNPYIGNISHLLVPTFPTVQLPNSMLRVYPERADYTSEYINGLPIIVTNHRERSAFNLIPQQGDKIITSASYTYDNEHIKPYAFDLDFNDNTMHARYAVSHQSAIYEIDFKQSGVLPNIVLTSQNGTINVGSNWISGSQIISGETKVYVYIESEETRVKASFVENGEMVAASSVAPGKEVAAVLQFPSDVSKVRLRYGVSFISEAQAKANLRRELKNYDIDALAKVGRAAWNEVLGRIDVKGGTEAERTVLYTSYYRTFERPICMSEDGKYWSAFDNKVHEDGGTPFYNDDWIWDTYRAAHPLRAITDAKLEENIIASYIRMAQQMGNMWMPTFPEVNGDSRRMNSNHGVAAVAEDLALGLNIDAATAFEACRKGIEEKTLAPWSGGKAGWLDNFYKEHGYIPALAAGETETDPNVHPFEKRQPVAVTLGTAYDEWCLSVIANYLANNTKNKKEANTYKAEAAKYLKNSYNYRTLYNAETGFFHPKDKAGNFIEPFDYNFPGGMGAREYYGENNGWVYRWDTPHNVADLINLMGGRDKFVANLDKTFSTPLGMGKYEFYAKLPDHTGNVGQFSMANEPSMHIPYLYNYAGAPWKTQKRIRQMLDTWFRADLMGVPGDEDGGGTTSFVVFSSLGFYPVTPGMATFNIGSPLFTDSQIRLSNGNVFHVVATNASADNKYIQSATLNGKTWDKPWFSYDDIKGGATLTLIMSNQPNKSWGANPEAAPPSAKEIK